jgi:hypothetical protein
LPVVGLLNENALQIMSISIPNKKGGASLPHNRHISGTRITKVDQALLPVVGLLNEYALQMMSISTPNKKGGVSLPQITDTSVEQG